MCLGNMNKFNSVHYCGEGKQDICQINMFKDIQNSGFKIEKTNRVFENPHHIFSVLIK